jgi:DNA-binding MarR family transcriptional regulator
MAAHAAAAADPVAAAGLTPDELLRLDNQLCFPLYACAKEVVHRYKPFLSQHDLTYTQYLVMLVLWEHDEQSVSSLGARLHLDSGTLTPLLKKMEAKGYLTRQRSADDERVVVICLTKTGAALKQQAYAIPLSMGRCMGLELSEAQELRRLLDKLMDNVSASEGA